MPFPWLAAAVAGGAALSAFGQHRSNVSNRNSAREQMAFQERMSGTSYQRSREDMISAGINPMLMQRLGGASTPPGAQYSAQNELTEASSSATGAMHRKAELKRLDAEARIAQERSNYEQPNLAMRLMLDNQQYKNLRVDKLATEAQALQSIQSAKESAARVTAIESTLPGKEAQSKFEAGTGGDILRWLNVLDQGVNSASNIFETLKPGFSINKLSKRFKFDKHHGYVDKSTGEIFGH